MKSAWFKALPMLAICAVIGAAGSSDAQAQYPNRPINVIIPFASGGATNALSEKVGREMAADLGQPMVADFRGGAGGTIAGQAVAKSAPDGYTLLMSSTGSIAVGPAVMKSVRYDPVKEFVPIALIATTPFIMLVNPSVPAKNIPELVAYVKANPGKVNFASSGTGGADHLAIEVFQMMAGLNMTHIPYKGAGPMLPDLISGRVQLAVISPIPVRQFLETGQLRAIAVTSKQRSPSLKDIPTIAEQGYPSYDVQGWYGYSAPAGTPHDVVVKLNAAARTALAKKDVVDFLLSNGLTPGTMSPEEFAAFSSQEVRKWQDFARQTRITVE